MKRLLKIAVVLAASSVPALGQDGAGAPTTASAAPAAAPVPAEADKLLWCGSAFYWLAASAEDSGETEEAETYDRWSKRLLEVAGASLTSAGFAPERIEQLVADYDQAALAELGTPEAPHDIVTCPDLLGDWR